ncbi:hypothetical protein [Arvimicrobium flavum]|uniref:hypothetical protein n=1 Tax=Arvimicrobium flavum TaxID=3393320 RepID=UPI00237A3465|nr:hypothetical protein [Mesorhizobium shangrilense]
MKRVSRLLPALLMAAMPGTEGFAQSPDKISYDATPGKELQLGIFATVAEPCQGAPIPQLRIAKAPVGGKLIIRVLAVPIPQTDQVCAGKRIPAQVVFYQSDTGFSGSDSVVLDVGVKGQPIRTQEISITVGK